MAATERGHFFLPTLRRQTMTLARALCGSLAGWIVIVAGFASKAPAQCCPAPVVCAPTPVVMEKQKMTVRRYRNETRERLVTVYRRVPEGQSVEEEYTVMVPQTRLRNVDVTINEPVPQSIELRTTTMTPITETRQATQTVCRMIPVQQERTVCEVVYPSCAERSPTPPTPTTENQVRNSIRTVAFARSANGDRDPNAPPPPPTANQPSANPPPAGAACDSCGAPASCDTCTPCCPQVVRRVVKVTCMQPISEQQTIDYPVTRFEPNVQARTVGYNLLEPRTETRVEEYTVDVPEKRTRTRDVTVWRTVPVEKKEQYQVTVPYKEQIEVTVPCAPPPANCGGCTY
jgi:hypothetical protein